MNNDIAQLIEASEKVCQQIKLLLASEQEKRQALLRQEADKIDGFVQSQQAMVMKLNSLEKKRMNAQEAAGFAGKTASEILSAVDEETKKILLPVFESLRNSADELQGLNRLSMDIAAAELKAMEHAGRAAGEDGGGLYNAEGKTGGSAAGGSAFRERI